MASRLLKSFVVLSAVLGSSNTSQAKDAIEAEYIPLADHYALLVAYEKYGAKMEHADLKITRMGSWPALKGKFQAKQADLAMVVAPIALNMYREDPSFKWVGLAHRNGSALAINDYLGKGLELSPDKAKRTPNAAVAEAFATAKAQSGTTPIVAVPSLEATHVLVLYKFLKDHNLTLSVASDDGAALAKAVAPPKSPDFLSAQNALGRPSAFVQSLPWADVVETTGNGKVAWYSKDVLPSKHGHLDCLVIAQNDAIATKNAAVKEVIYYIHQAAKDIEAASKAGPEALKGIAAMIRKHIPDHSEEVILSSLSKDLNVISYNHLNVDKAGMKEIMDLAIEAGIVKGSVDIDSFADDQFSTEITDR